MSFEGLSSDCLTEAGFCNSDARVIRNSQPWEKTNNPNPVANKKRTIELRQCFQNKTLQLEKLMGQLPKLINCPHWLLLGKSIMHEHTRALTHTHVRVRTHTV